MGRLAKLDPFGMLSTAYVLAVWIAGLLLLNGLWLLAAPALSHPAAKLGFLGAWAAWCGYCFAFRPGLDFGIAWLVAMSAYVVVRTVITWRREGVDSLRVGWRRPLVATDRWPELAGLSTSERRVVLSRARAALPRRRIFSPRVWAVMAVLLGLALLEGFVRSPDPDPGASLPTLFLTWLLILPLVIGHDPRSDEGPMREALRERVLPQFWREPWLWDRARREASGAGVLPRPS
jgi:hypothetical protein